MPTESVVIHAANIATLIDITNLNNRYRITLLSIKSHAIGVARDKFGCTNINNLTASNHAKRTRITTCNQNGIFALNIVPFTLLKLNSDVRKIANSKTESTGKVALLVISVNTCIVRRGDLFRGIRSAISADKTVATVKHGCVRRQAICRKISIGINGFQVATLIEHIAHIFDKTCIPITAIKIQRFQVGTTVEHIRHIGDTARRETGDIKPRQTRTVLEHTAHIFNAAGVPTGDIQFREA